MKEKFAGTVDSGYSKVVIDIHQLKTLHMGIIKLLLQAMQMCRDLGLQFVLVGNPQIVTECKGFEDTRGWAFFDSLDEAKASFDQKTSVPEMANA
jgi:two-component system cell cycle response regulator